MPLPSEEADEAARLERRRLQSINWLVRYAGDDEPFADKLARLGLVATDNEIETAFAAAGRLVSENEVASLKLATTNGEFVGFDPSAVEPIYFETIELEGPSLADRARALAEDALKAGDNKLHAALVRMQNGMGAGRRKSITQDTRHALRLDSAQKTFRRDLGFSANGCCAKPLRRRLRRVA